MLAPSLQLRARAELVRRQRVGQAEYDPQKTPDWATIARSDQLPPAWDWSTWLILAGRGWGKTRTGAEWFREKAKDVPLLRIIAPTFSDARDTCVEGESGLKAICGKRELVKWNRSIGEGEFSNGSRFKVFSGNEPDRLRGPQSYADWCDELGVWEYAEAAWDMAQMGLRLGKHPQVCVTTTPKPIKLIKDLLANPNTHTTRGSTYDNRENLAASFFENIIAKYEGTRLGRQELNAELLEDAPGALWKRDTIEANRYLKAPEMDMIVVGVDPTATSTGDEAGIITDGRAKIGNHQHLFVLADDSLHGSPREWATAAVTAYYRHKADLIVAESNNGGEMVAAVISQVDSSVPVKLVHASRAKRTRAEPIATIYEKSLGSDTPPRGHHVGRFMELEDELCQWVPGDPSPNRLDAHVWAATELMLVTRDASTMPNIFAP